MKIKNIIKNLESTNGLGNVKLLTPKHKQIILKLEEPNNQGVLECLNRKFTLALTHDSSFREPAGEIILQNHSEIILPAVAFPEVNGRDVVSSSPSTKVHDVLIEELGLDLNEEEATLLVGFNL